MRRLPDLALYLVTDPILCGPRGVEAVVAAAVRGGVTAVQLRDKTARHADMVAQARRLKAALAPAGVPLVVNDRVEVAVAADADGVHVGQDDGDPATVRARIGPDRLLGLSVEAPAHLAGVDPGVVDYVGAGPVRATATKPGHAPAIGFEGLAALVRGAQVPAVAIGGIGLGNAACAVACGAAGVAVVSAICAAPDPEAAARALRRAVEAARLGAAALPATGEAARL
jgi:thiamine-phosphate pyrophosphorylase